MPTYVEYNNGKRPWSINASKICSNKDLYDENPNDISGLILEATYGNINISTNNGITKFNNDVSFIGDISSNNLSSNKVTSNNVISNDVNIINKIILHKDDNTSNIDGNINLNGNFILNGNFELNTISETATNNFTNSTMVKSIIGIDSSGKYQDTLGISYANKAAFTDVSLNNLEVSNNIVTNNLLLKSKEYNLIDISNDFHTIHFQIINNNNNNNNNSYKYNNIDSSLNINTDFNNQSFSLKLNETYTFKFKHQSNFKIEVSYNSIFNNYILDNLINNNSVPTNFSTFNFRVTRNFQNMDLKIIVKDINDIIQETIELHNFFVFEYNINTAEKFTDIDNSINNLLISNKNANFNLIDSNLINNISLITTNSLNTNSLNIDDNIKIENNNGKMKLIFY